MSEEFSDSLAAVTVDVDTVEMPDLAGELDMLHAQPMPPVDGQQLAKGHFGYVTTLDLGGKEMSIVATRSIEQVEEIGTPRLRITSTSSTPMGEISDKLLLQAITLRPIRRRVQQPGATIEVDFDGRAFTGAIEAGGQTIPIYVELDAPIFAGESGLEAVLASMDLDEGFRASVRVAEIGTKQRVRLFSVQVEGSETIEVPAGRFETWRVRLRALDGEGGGQTVWLDKDRPRTTVKIKGRLSPQVGGMAYTTMLTERP